VPAYDAAFFDYVNTTSRAAANLIIPILNAALGPDSVLDVGCGQGEWLAAWERSGVNDVLGIDGDYVDLRKLQISADRFRGLDLTGGFDLQRQFDLVQCLEVAEHLPTACSDRLLDSLMRHGRLILFSAAPPGPGGHDHVNERSYEYWRQEFAHRGYVALDSLRPQIRGDERIASWYRYNPILYARRDTFPALSPSVQSSLIPEGTPVADLAPLHYRIRKQIVRRLSVSAMTAMARVKERVIGRKSPPKERL
jgi:SAM-dependent methyltransferase